MGTIAQLEVFTVNGSACYKPPAYVNHYSLTASVAKTITVPANAGYMLPRSNALVYARFDGGGAAVVPASDVTDGTGTTIFSGNYKVAPAATISVISPSAATVSVEYFIDTVS